MPEIITCPDCGRKLRVPDELVGKQVKCPDCKVKFTGGVTTAPNGEGKSSVARKKAAADPDQRVAAVPIKKKAAVPESDDEEDEKPVRPKKKPRRDEEEDEDHPRRRSEYDDDDDDEQDDAYSSRRPKRANKREGWMKVRLGLNLLVYSIYVQIAMYALGILGFTLMFLIMGIGISSMSSSSPNSGAAVGSMAGGMIGMMILFGFLGLMRLAHLGLEITGEGFGMMIPDKPGTGRKPLAIATFSCAIGYVVLTLLSFGLSCMGGGFRANGIGSVATGGGNFIGLINYAVQLGWFICLMLYLRSVAVSMREPGLASQIVMYMIAVPLYWVMVVVMGFIMAIAAGAAAFGAASSQSGGEAAATGGAFLVFAFGCGILAFALFVALFVWYVMLVHKVRNAVSNYLD